MNYQKHMLRLGDFFKTRKKAFWIVLLVYLMIFASIAYVIERNILVNLVKLSPYLEEYKTYENYAFGHTTMYKMQDGEWKYHHLSGQKYEENYLFSQNNPTFFNTEDFDQQVLNFEKLDNSYIYRYLQRATLVNSAEIAETYELSLKDFIKYVDKKNTKAEGVILITIIKNVDKVDQVDIDLTDYAKLNNKELESFIVSITYNKHGQIVDFTK
jgi:hypothetical protein